MVDRGFLSDIVRGMASSKTQSPDKWPKVVKSGFARVSVYRVAAKTAKTGWAYTIAYSDAGQRKRQTFADEGRAMAEAQQKVAKLAAGLRGAADLTGEDSQLLRAIRAKCGDTPPMVAFEEWVAASRLCDGNLMAAAQEWAAKSGDKKHTRTVAQAIAEFRAAKAAAGKDVKQTYKYLVHLADSTLGGINIRSITDTTLQQWLVGRYLQPVYRNTAVRRLRTLWSWARMKQYVDRDAQTAPERIENALEPEHRIGIVTTHDLRRIMTAMWEDPVQRSYMPALVLSALCGLRTTEAVRQQWADINLDSGHLRVSVAKRNTPAYRLVPIPPAAKAWLLTCGVETSGCVVTTRKAIECTRDKARELGIEIPKNAYRHGYISHAVAKEDNVDKVALWAGTSRDKVFSNYRELVSKTEGEDWFESDPKACKVN